MKSPGKIIVLLIAIFIVISSVFFMYSFDVSADSFIHQSAENELLRVSKVQQNNIIDLFKERKKDLEFLASMDGINDILTSDLISSNLMTKNNLNKNSKIIIKEIENYMISNSQLTLKDLQDNLEFNRIAVQKISEEGYSLIYDANDGRVLFHPDLSFLKDDIGYLEKISEDLYVQAKLIIQNGKYYSEGNYKLLGDDDIWREKFATHQKIPIKTYDGHELVLMSTAYIENYKISKNIDLELKSYLSDLIDISDYHGIYFIEKGGYVVYDDEKDGSLGLNIYNLNNALTDIFDKVIQSNEAIISGPHFEEYKKNAIAFSVGKSIYEGSKFLGVIILQFPADEVCRILSIENNVESYLESYLINNRGQLASPIKFKTGDVLVQEILTESAQNCLTEDVVKNQVSISKNYMGVKTFSTYSRIGELCLISEIEYQKYTLKTQDGSAKRGYIFFLFTIFFLLLSLFYVKKYIDSRYILKRRRIFKWLDLSNKFLKLITPRFAIFICGGIAFGVISILWGLYGYSYPELYQENMADLIIILLSLLILTHALTLKRIEIKNILFFGSLMIIIERFVEIIIQTIEITRSLSPNLIIWVFIYLIRYSGFILIVNGFLRRISK